MPLSIDGWDQERGSGGDGSALQEMLFRAEGVVDGVGFGVFGFEGYGYSAAPCALGVAGVD